ncbi:hypothetical protein BDW74DRAFT_175599 [Aspergillus multicolor]|uniref:methyltransferase family protein n=1 Tax=Aspergillus multicolor TaxID=41759 RepID=UPI003CCDF232
MSPSIPKNLFSAAVLYASYLTYRCQQPPNKNPTAVKQTNADPFTRSKFTLLIAYHGHLFLLLGAIHALLRSSLRKPKHPCSTLLPMLTIGGATLRLLSFAQLAKNFTFAVARPSSLITSGVYAYIQHPGYTGGVCALVGFSGLVLRTGGVFACWPGLWASAFVYANYIFVAGFVLWVVTVRVPHEEDMLKGAFGKEWEVYHARTARFIPWLL